MRKLNKWVPHELTKNQKILILKCLLSFYATRNHFSLELWHAMENGFYTTTGNDQLSDWTEKNSQSTSQSQNCTKKRSGHCVVVCCLSDPLQLSESQWNHYIWEVCLANWWDAVKTGTPPASTGKHKGPNSSPQQLLTTCHTTNTSKVEWIGLQSFASSAIFTWPLANRLPFPQASQQLFAGKCFHNQQ